MPNGVDICNPSSSSSSSSPYNIYNAPITNRRKNIGAEQYKVGIKLRNGKTEKNARDMDKTENNAVPADRA